jgi:hypothetical protein
VDAIETAYDVERAMASALSALTLEPEAVSGDPSHFELVWRTAGTGQQWLLRLRLELDSGEVAIEWGRTDWDARAFHPITELCPDDVRPAWLALSRPSLARDDPSQLADGFLQIGAILARVVAPFIEGSAELSPRTL